MKSNRGLIIWRIK